MITIHGSRSIRYGITAFLVIGLWAPAVYAAGSSSAISQTYEATGSNIPQGALLSLTSPESNSVSLADSGNSKNLVGIAANASLVELSGSGQTGGQTIQAVVGGISYALVSDLNGAVKVGDKITASPVNGIGMKAINSSEIVGAAQESLSAVQTVTKAVAGTDGKQVTMHVGMLPISVGVAYYSAASASGDASAFVPPFLQSLANQLTGKQVSPLRVLLGSAALVLGFIAVTIMLYVAIQSGIISIGRNPLAETALRKGLVDVIIAAIGVLVVTVVVVYAILQL